MSRPDITHEKYQIKFISISKAKSIRFHCNDRQLHSFQTHKINSVSLFWRGTDRQKRYVKQLFHHLLVIRGKVPYAFPHVAVEFAESDFGKSHLRRHIRAQISPSPHVSSIIDNACTVPYNRPDRFPSPNTDIIYGGSNHKVTASLKAREIRIEMSPERIFGLWRSSSNTANFFAIYLIRAQESSNLNVAPYLVKRFSALAVLTSRSSTEGRGSRDL
ncbi:hypothetical protein H6P81_018243 [Aristolochia fimbriata]|uniref:Uncharacterized protein n=1 Tax=Aristolochia fimbriata TaxID=158543 RepID=A0AAV7E2D3_ARIFI|nr:hypothetical protein H6P81_018243 [Aristolochia fimbriata]